MKNQTTDWNDEQSPRQLRTPIVRAESLLIYLEEVLSGCFPQGIPASMKSVFDTENRSVAISGDKLISYVMRDLPEGTDNDLNELGVVVAAASCYCVQAIIAYKDGRLDEAWDQISDAEYFSGLVIGMTETKKSIRDIREVARKANSIRHAETADMKRLVWLWCGDNLDKYRSIDSAASSIAEKLVPVKFRTVQRWISEFKRSSRPTS